ncbi:MAG: hypothetical protein GEU99_15385 [Luteitalea sp.]|nr:hypothetical protein [Luteitalea sp.]
MDRILMRLTSVGCAALLAATAAPASAAAVKSSLAISASSMQTMGAEDVDDLQRRAKALGTAVDDLRGRDAARADTLQSELDTLEDEIVYLRVKLQKEGEVSSQEFEGVRDRLADLEVRAKGQQITSEAASSSKPRSIPVGQEIDVRLQTRLSSETAQVEDRFEATTLVDLSHGEELLIPAGSVMGGVVSAVNRATRTDRKGSLTLAFDTLTVDGQTYKIRAPVTDAVESQGLKGEAGRATAGAVAGAIIGGILGGGKGVLAGLVIGGGGTILATPGQNVSLDAGTVLRARFDSPVTLEPTSPAQP